MSDAVNKPAHYNQGPIECIDAMQQILTPEEFRGFLKGNVFKYLWREKGKNGIEDLRKGKSYYDLLIELVDETEAEQLATGEVAVEVTGEVKPPDGWRWLEVGETLQRGDTTNTIEEIQEDWIGIKCAVKHNLLRRNRFEVGEKVKHINGIHACAVVECDHEKDQYVIVYNGRKYVYESKCLVPYIEEAK